ncbi:MAG: FG-GAP repeat protein, partial [Polyangiaceae bacterium]|nr:FG-GAP repeat protein [Polyangiaceae bacterium]
GDLDGDGYADLVVGAPYWDGPGGYDEGLVGQVYVYYGSAAGLDTSREVRLGTLDAGRGDYLGYAVAGGGDLNGDGLPEIMAGAPYDDTLHTNAGAVYVYWGQTTGYSDTSTQEINPSRTDINHYAGSSVADAGDLDADGYDDLIIGTGETTDSAHVLYGSAVGVDVNREDRLAGGNGSDFGYAVDGGPDVDGDGFSDLVVGESGWVYVFFGSSVGVDPASVQALSGSQVGSENMGRAVSMANDVDGDGVVDLLVGNWYDTSYTGAAVLYLGSSAGFDATAGVRLVASDGVSQDRYGYSVALLGDTDGDGFGELAMGAAWDEDQARDAGAVYVYAGGCDDFDDDGACSWEDCDDSDPDVNPDATERIADGVDSDCDGVERCYADLDGDGFTAGETGSADVDCSDPGEASAASAEEDCDDNDPAVYPGAEELAGDEIDSDCDGAERCYADGDADGYTAGERTSEDSDCADDGEAREASAEEDCDDADPEVYPGAEEGVADGVDSDCDGAELCHGDLDADGFTEDTVVSEDLSCAEAGEATEASALPDCDDADPAVFPGAEERCDGVDEDCDAAVDEGACGDTGLSSGDKGCGGCGAAGGAPWGWALAALALVRRRRAYRA